MHSRYLYSTSETPAAQLVWMESIPSTYLLPLLFTYLIQLDTFPRHTHIYSKLKQTMCVKILFSSVSKTLLILLGRHHIYNVFIKLWNTGMQGVTSCKCSVDK